MELSDLRAFVAVAEELHFGRAAERLHLTQPPLSRQIRRFEAELDVLLFRRTSRTVGLTDAGAALLPEARAILAAAAAAAETARRAHRGETGRLEIGAVTPAIDGFLPAIVRRFREAHPGIALTVTEMDTSAQLDALRANRLQAGFVRLAGHDVRELTTDVAQREPHVVALPEGHPLAEKETVPLRALAGAPFIVLAPDAHPSQHRRLTAACAAAGFAPRIVQSARTFQTVTALVAAGIGVAIVPESAARAGRRGLTVRALRGRFPAAEISLAWRKFDPSAALRAFRACVAAATGQ